MNRELKYTEAIKEATVQAMEKDESVFIIGEGVPDPKGIFGTTIGLEEKFGKNRVFDMPLSENGLTGVCIGAALTGFRPIITHQRLDFALLCVDQLFNNAAKWYSMFAGQKSVPLVVRLVIGRGWGQGAQHSQNLQAIFSHVPGLKVVMPANAYDAKGMLISAVEDNNTVIFIEHRWLHNTTSDVPKDYYKVPIGKCHVAREGKDFTIVSTSYMTLEALKAAEILEKYGIDIEVVDVRTLQPLDRETILTSVEKTGTLLAMDSGYYTGGFASEIIASVTEKLHNKLVIPPGRITLPDLPTPSTRSLTDHYYPQTVDIVKKILEMLNNFDLIKELIPKMQEENKNKKLDVPDSSFTGPF